MLLRRRCLGAATGKLLIELWEQPTQDDGIGAHELGNFVRPAIAKAGP
ncbi:MAG: hypothetical protein HY329_17300 [Chloroflexi bacterium]|nr:hypothetical protein [Chloroflexota bacterium]